MIDVIHKKRDKGVLTEQEILFFIEGYCSGLIPDYQASALLMAIFLNGLNDQETVYLTKAMLFSGDRIDLSSIPGVKVDKHSTGGVGDKTTLICAPIVAALGIPVVKMSGRGLSFTGGTLDKLESIPGFETNLSKERFLLQVQKIQIAISGQTGSLAPADKLLYALRDATDTVDHIALIASSIMSKKLAMGAEKIVFDVKVGKGAFMKSFEDANVLAKKMVRIARHMGSQAMAVLSNMDEPLGCAVGNALEVQEALEVLKGRGASDITELSFVLAEQMIRLATGMNPTDAKKQVQDVVKSGKALEKFKEMVRFQKGEDVFDDPMFFEKAAFNCEVCAEKDGCIESIHSEFIGKASVILGVGRSKKEDIVDPFAGILFYKKKGDIIKKGECIARLFCAKEQLVQEAKKVVTEAIRITQDKVVKEPLILGYVME